MSRSEYLISVYNRYINIMQIALQKATDERKIIYLTGRIAICKMIVSLYKGK